MCGGPVKSNGHDILKVESRDEKVSSKFRSYMLDHFADLDEPIKLPSAYQSAPVEVVVVEKIVEKVVEVIVEVPAERPPEIPPTTVDGRALGAMLSNGMTLDEAASVLLRASENSTGTSTVIHRNSGLDQMAEKRRAWDRERKRKKAAEAKRAKDNSTVLPPDTKNVVTLKEVKIDTEEEVKERKKVRAPIVYSKDFEIFWAAYPRRPNMGKAETFAVWKKISPEERQLATEAAPKFDAWVKTQKPDYTVLHACRFLSKRRADAFQTEARSSKATDFSIPPWEREGLTESEFREKERRLLNGQG